MNEEVAYGAIDYLGQHSVKNEKVAISFYGGEPLLRFPLIKSCVEYAGSNLKNREISFSITTNGSLLTVEMADFFFNNNFSVFVSLDGPQDIHDDYRKDRAGKGSYHRAVRGLKNLVHAYGEAAKEKVRLSIVYTPPFSGKRIDRVAALWDEIPWLPREIEVALTYPTPGTIPKERLAAFHSLEDRDLLAWAYDKYRDKYLEREQIHPLAKSIIEKDLAMLTKRPIYHEPIDRYSLNGCCIPGVRRLYVTTAGTFRLCERISSDAPTIGDVYSGVDLEVIKKIYIDGYKEMSVPSCSTCWAVRLCTSCYTTVFRDGKLDINTKDENCMYIKSVQERLLGYYCSLLEKDADGLDYLYDLELE